MKKTDTILDRIITAKQDYLRDQKSKKPQAQIERELASVPSFAGPGFFEALKAATPKPKIIAEVKQASPSGGVLRQDFSLADINQAYQAAPNVVAISVLTEREHFRGSEAALAFFAANNTHNKPLLRKDFLFDPYQILESKLLGAQAYLLIASLFDKRELEELIELGHAIGLEPLVEVHDRQELELVLETKARSIGVNCRDLRDFTIDIKTHELLRGLDGSYARVAESGIDTPEYLDYLLAFADAALIGGHFMAAPDLEAAIEKITAQTGDKEAA
jgi:indole-3-glycerol phosphate synthase